MGVASLRRSNATDYRGRSMPNILKELSISDVSSVSAGAGRGVKVLLMKSHQQETTMSDVISKAAAMPERELVAFAKTDGISKVQLCQLIEDKAEALRQRGESRETAYTKFITEDPLGRELHLIAKAAAGPDNRQQAALDAARSAAAPSAPATVAGDPMSQIAA